MDDRYSIGIQPHSASLVHITPDAEQFISYMARVSNPSNQANTETSARLIKYLIKHRHWSPFEMVSMCVQVDTTRSIAAQILRHRSFSFQEFSTRYAKVESQPVMPQFRRQDLKNRQNSIDDLNDSALEVAKNLAEVAFEGCFGVYERLIELGVAKECAREVLPLATPTRMYMSGTIRSWLHYCDLRTKNGTQKEHAIIAGQCMDILYRQVPSIAEAMWNQEVEA